MRWWSFGLLGAVCSVGCTNLALERHTVKQVETGADLRYKDILNNLAVFADVPYSLPSLNAIFSGSTKITDQLQATSQTVIGRQTLGPNANVVTGTATFPQSETLTIPGQRQIYGMWTLDPVSSPEKLRAIRACCWRVLYGPDFGAAEDHALLKKYNPKANTDPPGHYFDVLDDLKDIEAHHPGWLCHGCMSEVPLRACYKAHCRGHWVWVMPDGMEGLSKFTLIMTKLARVPTDAYYFPQAQDRKSVV